MRRISKLVVAAALTFGASSSLAPIADAGVIGAGGAIVGGGLGSLTVTDFATGAANNDDFAGAGNPNFLTFDTVFDNNAEIDLELNVDASQGVTEYLFVNTVLNNTGSAWDAFAVALGFGSGASFVLSTAGDGLAMDGSGASIAPFTSAAGSLEAQTLSGAVIDPGDSFVLSLSVDIPDGIQTLTYRQLPVPVVTSVPEPASAAVLLAGLVGAGLLRRRLSAKAR